ncbi:hypothetical protein BGZ61DRAFT_441169 [Ilyonectria robusta]|uniref:uncharacterized protein n=1 Tax=Ilyonectria robusta TaxID=1079257 RepID=UPI001E8ECE55|nr:uncharacterized protein BGZ61DRAFT_441169 [Ilyonectria robusta]KAH8735906.1 hypothetical protein BGZ61DRAFT_441169 [Ilyonectria robusta]
MRGQAEARAPSLDRRHFSQHGQLRRIDSAPSIRSCPMPAFCQGSGGTCTDARDAASSRAIPDEARESFCTKPG